ncbi:MAG TPA: hypothetical protein VGQ83_05115 [Polyangia bacterium]|jgi:predicted regulator of Ras-like GTPase activity (Roadblock/LC7/MglB family)
MNETPFTPILRQTFEALPDAIGVVFADWQGEAVDRFPEPRDAASTPGRTLQGETVDLRLFGAHWGIILAQVQAALRTFHYGDAFELILQHDELDVLMHAVSGDYYVLLALPAHGPLGRALLELRRAAAALRAEM